MIISPYHRFFVHLEIRFRAAHDRGKAMQLIDSDTRNPDAITTLRQALRGNDAKITLGLNDELELLLIKHIVEMDMIVLLFKRSDPNASTQMYSHRTTREIRKADRKRDEDVAHSAHLFISCANKGTIDAPQYNALLEEVPGIARGHVMDVLSRILKNSPYGYRNSRGEDKQTHTVADVVGVPNETLENAIVGGRIPRVTLIREAVTDGLDTEGQAFPRQQRMPISLKAVPDPIRLVRRIKEWGQANGWTDFRVDIEMPEHRSRTVSMTRDEDASSAMFIRSIPVELANPIDVCTHQVIDELVEHAHKHLQEGD